MPETKSRAIKRARKLHIPTSHVIKGKRGYYISPRGADTAKQKHMYAALRDQGYSKESSARIMFSRTE